MTIKEVQQILPLMQAYVEGKTIQLWDENKEEWVDTSNPSFLLSYPLYRIKPTCVPFASKEECLEEMKKHEPFGWLIKDDSCVHVVEIYPNGVSTADEDYDYIDGLECFTFLDGKPFGKPA